MSLLGYLGAAITSILVSIPTLHLLASVTHAPVLSFAARSIASFSALVFCACYGVVASIVLRLVGYGGLSQWTTARSFKWTMWLLTGVEFKITDKYAGLKVRPGVFIGNHQTELDVLMLGCIFPPYCSVTAKSSLKWMPFLGQFMALSKTVFINRTSRSEAMAAFSQAAETMHSEQQSVYIFPEGTRSYANTPTLLPFKKGAFHLAVQAQVPIVPVVVANYSNVLDVKNKIFNSGVVPVSVLKPVETKGLTKDDVDGLVERIQKDMAEELVRITYVAQKKGVAGSDASARASKSSGVDVGISG
ncbi:1-acylglycerol-3-phosphate O [Aureobasidium melanogenum CBS 110374]|uniref:1-acyl-sn-glycerol-3-phosphate acyltransferase n=1 Tax=Aureobasidium melanogenum (strain CBS 110374) TaxID=1043003 RepID=A0A074W474_AURM1|nr:1-acylglycerol-3-phosphate O [Aureobasidium melanogenum CBS 110374]KEQ67623.1 1-acylglycerol-3-phosphate O [Aureobasidium melanogenum CBS 110374]